MYRNGVLGKLENMIPQSTASAIQLAVYANDAQALQEKLKKLLLQSASFFDTAGENFYHRLMLGLCAANVSVKYLPIRESPQPGGSLATG